jgi:hypothetical protein
MRTYTFAPKRATGPNGVATKAVVNCMTSCYVIFRSVSQFAIVLTTFAFPMLEVACSKIPSGMTQS